jgi:hypothetical protein
MYALKIFPSSRTMDEWNDGCENKKSKLGPAVLGELVAKSSLLPKVHTIVKEHKIRSNESLEM